MGEQGESCSCKTEVEKWRRGLCAKGALAGSTGMHGEMDWDQAVQGIINQAADSHVI